MTDLQKALAYVNKVYRKLSGEIALKADAGESVDLSDIYTKSEVDALIPVVPTVPTALADLSEDITHRVVTDAEKTTWNNKLSFETSHADVLVDDDIGVTVQGYKVPQSVFQLSDAEFPYQILDTNDYIYSIYVRSGDVVLNLVEYTLALGRITYIHITQLDSPYTLTIQDTTCTYELILTNADQGKIYGFLPINNDAFAGYKLVAVYPAGGSAASDIAYDATTWDGNTDAPTKNAVRDKFESLTSGGLTQEQIEGFI